MQTHIPRLQLNLSLLEELNGWSGRYEHLRRPLRREIYLLVTVKLDLSAKHFVFKALIKSGKMKTRVQKELYVTILTAKAAIERGEDSRLHCF